MLFVSTCDEADYLEMLFQNLYFHNASGEIKKTEDKEEVKKESQR